MKNYEYYFGNPDRFKELYDAFDLKSDKKTREIYDDVGIKMDESRSFEQDFLKFLQEERGTEIELIDITYLIMLISNQPLLSQHKMIEILKVVFTLKPRVYDPIANKFGYDKKEVIYILGQICNAYEYEEIMFFANNFVTTHTITIKEDNNGNGNNRNTNT